MHTTDVHQAFETLARNFYTLFETMLSIYDKDRSIICTYPPQMGPLCSLIRTDCELERRCLYHDELAFEMCDKTLRPYIYHCHMGLVEVAAPIVGDGVVLGYLLFGQIADDEKKELILQRIQSLDFGPPRDELIRLLQQVRVRSVEYIEAMSSVLAASAAYIQVSDVFALQKESLSFRISEYIRENLAAGVDMSRICAHFGISRSALYALSRKYYGMGISDHINRVRINVAKKLLLTGMPVGDVAAAVGIADSSYFTRVFKRYSSLTPKKYQELFRDKTEKGQFWIRDE